MALTFLIVFAAAHFENADFFAATVGNHFGYHFGFGGFFA